MEAGEPAAQAGTFDKYLWEHYIFDLPDDPDFWPFFGYIGGEPFGTQATIPAARKIEFETELLRICPERLWLGVMVNYN